MNALCDNFLGADFRPVGLTAGSRALVGVVDDLGLAVPTGSRDDTGRRPWANDRPRGPGAARLGRRAARARRRRTRARRAELDSGAEELRSVAQGRYREDIAEMLARDRRRGRRRGGPRAAEPPHLRGDDRA